MAARCADPDLHSALGSGAQAQALEVVGEILGDEGFERIGVRRRDDDGPVERQTARRRSGGDAQRSMGDAHQEKQQATETQRHRESATPSVPLCLRGCVH